jgi:nucleoside-diphosphate-sugar epimerase
MNILVTGADGCLGSALVRDLAAAGRKVFGTTFWRIPGERECLLDLAREESFRDLPAGRWDTVIHAAGLVDQSLPAGLLHRVNALGTRRLAAWAAAHGCRHFIFLSSVSVYGFLTMGQNRSEHTPVSRWLAPLPYMRSKILAERFVTQSGLPYTILRLPPVLGCGDSYLSPAMLSALSAGRFFFAGQGDRPVSVMTVSGLGPVVDDLLSSGPLNAAYNCADHHPLWRDLAAEYARCLGAPLPADQRTIFSFLPLLSDKPALLLLAFSLFGAHFPDEAFHRALRHEHAGRWQEAVREAVEEFRLQKNRGAEERGGRKDFGQRA